MLEKIKQFVLTVLYPKRKAFAAFLSSLIVWFNVAWADGVISTQEWIGLAMVVLGTGIVHQVTNKPVPTVLPPTVPGVPVPPVAAPEGLPLTV